MIQSGQPSASTIELRPIQSESQPGAQATNNGRFAHKSVSELADNDHVLLSRSPLQKGLDATWTTLYELGRFNISQPLINLVNYSRMPDDPIKSACIQANEQHMQALYDRDYEQFLSHSTQDYIAKTNEQIFGSDNQPLINSDVQNSFTDIIKSIILGDHNKTFPPDQMAEPDQQGTTSDPSNPTNENDIAEETVHSDSVPTSDQGSQPVGSTPFHSKLENVYELLASGNNVHVNEEAALQLDKLHTPTPETILAKLKQDIENGGDREALLEQLKGDCEQLATFLLKTSAMSLYVKSLKIDSPLNTGQSKAQMAAGFINKAAAFLSDKVPPFYLLVLGVVLLERLAAGDLKADALNDFMSAPNLNITAEVRKNVTQYARNLYRAEKVDDVRLKPGNVVTTAMAFTLYITGSLQLLISQADHSKNSEIMDKCFQDFILNEPKVKDVLDPKTDSSLVNAADSIVHGISVIAIGLRAMMNGAYEVKDATPDTPERDLVYNSILGKTFVYLSLQENAGYKDSSINKNKDVQFQRCLTKQIIGEPLTGEEKDFLNAINGEPGSHYSWKAKLTRIFTYGTVALSTGALATDIAMALTNPEASKAFWNSPVRPGGIVTFSHVHKGAVRPISAFLNALQVMWVSGSEYTKDDVEAFVHIFSRLLLATAPLIMWEKGTTLLDSIAAMIDTAITVGEDSAASRSLNRGQLAKQVEVATNNIRLQAFKQQTDSAPSSTGEYLDQLTSGLLSGLKPDHDVPEQILSTDPEPSELRRRSPSDVTATDA